MTHWLIIAVIAAGAMAVQDFISAASTVVVANANSRWRPSIIAGLLDVAWWTVSITTTTIAVSAFAGHSPWAAKFLVGGLIQAANFSGTALGVRYGGSWFKAAPAAEKVVTKEP